MENKYLLTLDDHVSMKMQRFANENNVEIEQNSLCQCVEHAYDHFGFYDFNLKPMYEEFKGDPSIIQ